MSTEQTLLAIGTEVVTLNTAETGYISAIEYRTEGVKQAFYIVTFPDRKWLAAQQFAYPVAIFLDLCGYRITPDSPVMPESGNVLSKKSLDCKANRMLKRSWTAYLYNEALHALRAYRHYTAVSVNVSTFYREVAQRYAARIEHLRALDYQTFMKAVKSDRAYVTYVYGIFGQ